MTLPINQAQQRFETKDHTCVKQTGSLFEINTPVTHTHTHTHSHSHNRKRKILSYTFAIQSLTNVCKHLSPNGQTVHASNKCLDMTVMCDLTWKGKKNSWLLFLKHKEQKYFKICNCVVCPFYVIWAVKLNSSSCTLSSSEAYSGTLRVVLLSQQVPSVQQLFCGPVNCSVSFRSKASPLGTFTHMWQFVDLLLYYLLRGESGR